MLGMNATLRLGLVGASITLALNLFDLLVLNSLLRARRT
jgi:hypothetical protein